MHKLLMHVHEHYQCIQGSLYAFSSVNYPASTVSVSLSGRVAGNESSVVGSCERFVEYCVSVDIMFARCDHDKFKGIYMVTRLA